jgi:hypothetical protein
MDHNATVTIIGLFRIGERTGIDLRETARAGHADAPRITMSPGWPLGFRALPGSGIPGIGRGIGGSGNIRLDRGHDTALVH